MIYKIRFNQNRKVEPLKVVYNPRNNFPRSGFIPLWNQ